MGRRRVGRGMGGRMARKGGWKEGGPGRGKGGRRVG